MSPEHSPVKEATPSKNQTGPGGLVSLLNGRRD
jgi:hypothetical protein